MRSKTGTTPARSPEAIPDWVTGPAGNGSAVATEPGGARARTSAAPATGGETRGEHFRRKAHRTRLHGYAIAAVALSAALIALAASNTAHVKVNWVLGSSHVSLVWLVLCAALLGWLLGLLASARFHWRTRAPRRPRGGRS
jgi:uncharacterized integral membrane protein